MWKEIIKLDGVVESSTNDPVDVSKMFELLETNGFVFEGGFEIYKMEDLSNTIKQIDDYITEVKFNRMLDKLKDFYGTMSEEEIIGFFETNFGSGVFNGVIEDILKDNKELQSQFKKYSRASSQISDTFGSDLGDCLAKRIAVQETKS